MENKKKKENKRKPPSFLRLISTVLLALLLISIIYSFVSSKSKNSKIVEISISQIARDINEGKISKIDVAEDKVTATYSDKSVKVTKKEADSSFTETLKNYGVTPENLSKTEINFKNNSSTKAIIGNILQIFGPFLLIIFFLWFLTRQMKGSGGMQALSFGQSKARMIDPDSEKDRVTFKDIAGCKEAKEELSEIVDFLKNPKKFLDIGARIPKGVLLTGAPGTGKTLLARAVAGEAGVPFFHISGSEFVELFVGIGASRVRDLFAVAKKTSPSIIFVDEIDAVGRIRGSGIGGGNDEREQTLNQILVEMDGFEPAEKVIVMAATNRNDVLDPALLRPGRFDRRVILDLPDRNDREEILKIHLKGKPQESDVIAKLIAERTSGFSGADLFSLVNESAILAARENRKTVSQIDLIRSIEKVLLGPERKSHLYSAHEKEICAYHEAGHAILASVLPDADPVHKVTIISRGNAGGYTMHIPLEDRKLKSKKEFIDDITMSLGGYVAEKMIFGDVTTGPSSDLQVSTAMARAMVTRFGMSDLGVLALEDEKQIYENKTQYSDKIAGQVDDEVLKIMAQAKSKAEELLTKHRDALDTVAKKLIEVETLEQEEYNKLIISCGITPKIKAVEV